MDVQCRFQGDTELHPMGSTSWIGGNAPSPAILYQEVALSEPSTAYRLNTMIHLYFDLRCAENLQAIMFSLHCF